MRKVEEIWVANVLADIGGLWRCSWSSRSSWAVQRSRRCLKRSSQRVENIARRMCRTDHAELSLPPIAEQQLWAVSRKSMARSKDSLTARRRHDLCAQEPISLVWKESRTTCLIWRGQKTSEGQLMPKDHTATTDISCIGKSRSSTQTKGTSVPRLGHSARFKFTFETQIHDFTFHIHYFHQHNHSGYTIFLVTPPSTTISVPVTNSLSTRNMTALQTSSTFPTLPARCHR